MCTNLEELTKWYLKHIDHYTCDPNTELTIIRIIDDKVEVKIQYDSGYYSDDCIFSHTEMMLAYINNKD